jgi:hypothetical protein
MKRNIFFRNLLINLLGFLAIGALFGGLAFIIRPDGSIYQMPVEELANSPFKNFLLPGIALIIWINVQTLILNSVAILHTTYSTLGILIICIAILPQTRKYYKL